MTPGTNPYNVTSQFTLTQLGESGTDYIGKFVTIDSRTDVFSAPSRPPSPWP